MWWSFLILIYFLPTLIALKKENPLVIFLFNLFLGVTGVGWLVSLGWAMLAEESEWYDTMKFRCKKCGQHYQAPNNSWYGQALICSQCDNFIRVPTPWFTWIGDISVPLIIFIWIMGTLFYHFAARYSM